MELLERGLTVVVLSVHLQGSTVAAIINCPGQGQGQFTAPRVLRPVVLQAFCLIQETLSSSSKMA